jgi:hypothetical protein
MQQKPFMALQRGPDTTFFLTSGSNEVMMSNTLPIMINDRDVSPLFDPSVPAIPFSAPRVDDIPAPGSIIYTVWRDQIDFIYVGIGGVGQSADTPLEKRNPRSRIVQHSSGRRSGDQFCVYVHDFYVIPDLGSGPINIFPGAIG